MCAILEKNFLLKLGSFQNNDFHKTNVQNKDIWAFYEVKRPLVFVQHLGLPKKKEMLFVQGIKSSQTQQFITHKNVEATCFDFCWVIIRP